MCARSGLARSGSQAATSSLLDIGIPTVRCGLMLVNSDQRPATHHTSQVMQLSTPQAIAPQAQRYSRLVPNTRIVGKWSGPSGCFMLMYSIRHSSASSDSHPCWLHNIHRPQRLFRWPFPGLSHICLPLPSLCHWKLVLAAIIVRSALTQCGECERAAVLTKARPWAIRPTASLPHRGLRIPSTQCPRAKWVRWTDDSLHREFDRETRFQRYCFASTYDTRCSRCAWRQV